VPDTVPKYNAAIKVDLTELKLPVTELKLHEPQPHLDSEAVRALEVAGQLQTLITTVDGMAAFATTAECYCRSCVLARERAHVRHVETEITKYRTVTLHCPTCQRVFCDILLRQGDHIPDVRCDGCILEGRLQPWPGT